MTIDALAPAATASGHAEHACRLSGVAEQIWHALDAPQMSIPELVAARLACQDQARHLIGDDAYETPFHTSHDTDPDAAIANTPPPLPPSHDR